nr:polysaccharide deacetylase family protein [Candidatus Njordarchaeum guaymaensis]
MVEIAFVDPYGKAREVVGQLLSPWDVIFSESDRADVVLSYGTLIQTAKPTVAIPSKAPESCRCCEENGLRVINASNRKLDVLATETVKLNIRPRTGHLHTSPSRSETLGNEPSLAQSGHAAYLFPFDLVEEYLSKLNQVLNPEVSSIYGLLTGFPIPYRKAPSMVRRLLLRSWKVNQNGAYSDHLDVDALRYLLVRAIEGVTGRTLQKRTWKGCRYACLLTHDIDTQEGLQRALILKRLEETYDVPSAFFLLTDTYKLDADVVQKLTNYGEVGVHDTKHDGKLIHLSLNGIKERLRKAKQTLERTAQQDIVGFRAPLLQHNKNIMAALTDLGYEYDASIPTWEPKHPSTMGPHGIGTIYPIRIGGMVEIPTTVIQDHQLLYALGLQPREAIAVWLSTMALIKELGGCCVLLSHPDYELFKTGNLAQYEELLNMIASDKQGWVTTPRQVADAVAL